jgi:Cu/Ag efflux pump CusA
LLLIALAAGIMVAGILQIARMPVDVLPETTPVTVDVQTEAAGLSAPEVESLVTVPLQKNLLEGVLGVTDVTSDSIEGLSDIELHFAPGTGLYHARQLVQERLTGAFVLPNVSKPPVMLQPVSSTSDVMLVGLSSKTLDPIDLSVLARWTIVPRLLALQGVANVSTFGQADQQLQVLVDPAKLAAHHVSVAQIIETAGDAQLVSPLSYLQQSTPGTGGFLEGPDQRINIQPVLPFGTPKNMAELPVTDAPAGLRLGDVATIVRGSPPLIGNGQINGAPGLVLQVQKAPGANVLVVSSAIDQALASLHQGLPGVTFSTSLFRDDTYLHSSLGNVRTALIIAGILMVIALLVLLLLGLRLILAALVGVAVSYVAATALLSLLGYSFNALLTLGLLLALGFVVTEAAGAAQAIASRLAAARSDGNASGAGAGADADGRSRTALAVGLVTGACGDVRGALAAGGVATLACIVPLLIASGLTATFLRPMAAAFALAVLVSMIIAVTITPAVAVGLLALPGGRPGGLLGGRLTAVPGRLDGWRGRALTALSAAPRSAVACVAACAVAGIAALAGLFFVHPAQPTFNDRELVVHLTGPPGMSLTELNRMAGLQTAELRALPSVAGVAATLGRAVTSNQIVNVNSGDLWVTLKPSAAYAQAVAAVGAIAGGTPGLTGTVSTYESDGMAGVLESGPATVTTRIYGLDYGELAKLATGLQTTIGHLPGVTGASVAQPVNQPTLDITVNLDAAARADISPGDVRREAGTLLSGLTVGNYFENQAVFDVVVWGTPAVRASISSVENLLLDTNNGGHVRLGQLASVSTQPQPVGIPQEAMARYVDITATVSGGSAGAVSAAISAKLAAMSFPSEYHAELVTGNGAAGNGLSPNGSAVAGTSRFTLISYVIAALAAIVLIFQAATGSWRLAALSFAALPVCLSGAAGVTFATGSGNALAAAAGLLAVFALAARQLIGVAARARSAAGSTAGGALEILTPALVTAVALAPFITMGDVPGMELLHTAAAVILGGLVTTALVSLFAAPVLFRLLGPAPETESAAAPGTLAADHVPSARQAADGHVTAGLAAGPPPAAAPPGEPTTRFEEDAS